MIINILREEISKVDATGCLMLDMRNKISNWGDVLKLIEPEDVYMDDTDDYGLEDEPHITILYGFEPDVTIDDIKSKFESVKKNVKFSIKSIDIFPCKEGGKYEVVKFTVESEDLQKLNILCKELPNKQTFPDYKAHMTIAYVKKGRGEKYVKKFSEPMIMEGNSFSFSSGKNTPKSVWKISDK